MAEIKIIQNHLKDLKEAWTNYDSSYKEAFGSETLVLHVQEEKRIVEEFKTEENDEMEEIQPTRDEPNVNLNLLMNNKRAISEKLMQILKEMEKGYIQNEKLAQNLAKAEETLTKVLKGTKSMVETLIEISQNISEIERLRLRCLDIRNENPGHFDSTLEFKNIKRKPSDSGSLDFDTEIKKSKLFDKTSSKFNDKNWSEENNSNEKGDTTGKTVEQEFMSTKFNIQKEYKLKENSNFDIWMDYLRSELINNDLIDVIDPNIKETQVWSESIIVKRKNLVRDIIINRLDENHHQKILNLSEPLEILKRLSSKRNKVYPCMRMHFYSTKMKKDETVYDFCERFDSILKECEAYNDVIQLTTQEIRSVFYQAVSSVIPELRIMNFVQKQTSSEDMTLEEMKSFITQLDVEKTLETKKEVSKCQRICSSTATKKAVTRCYRCNKKGHWSKNCPLKAQNKWFCFFCQAIRSHKRNNCTSATNYITKKRYDKQNFRSKNYEKFKKEKYEYNASYKNRETEKIKRTRCIEDGENQNESDES